VIVLIIIHVDKVQFFDTHAIKDSKGNNAYPGCDGAVLYELYYPDGVDLQGPNTPKPNLHHWSYMMQPFALGNMRLRPGATQEEINDNRANIWGWDGNREAPTLQPSFLCDDKLMGVKVHLFLVKGQIQLCSDSNVTVGEVPKVDIDE
jgi:hypothetical protein